MEATQKVIESDKLLDQFDIPEVLWPRLREVWNNKPHSGIHGRLDFAISQRGIKVYEYNADSSSCLMECGLIQNKWAATVGADIGTDPGHQLFEALVNAWKSVETETVHMFKD